MIQQTCAGNNDPPLDIIAKKHRGFPFQPIKNGRRSARYEKFR
jgi:hypothetical protein